MDNITRQQIRDILDKTWMNGIESYEAMQQIWPKIEALQKENAELKRQLEIAEINEKILILDASRDNGEVTEKRFAKQAIELETRLKELKGE